MSSRHPPLFLERCLLFLLPERDRDTIAGDLEEEFHHRSESQAGWPGPYVWYVLQIASFLPHSPKLVGGARLLLRCNCFFTGAAGMWLGFMDYYLGHPAAREWIAGTIVGESLITLLALSSTARHTLSLLSRAGTVPILCLAGTAMYGLITGPDFEGYILLIALGLIVQTILTFYVFSRRRPNYPRAVASSTR